MSKLNVLLHLNGYEDENPTNNPTKNNFKWTVDEQGIDIQEPESKLLKLQSGQSLSLFSGEVSISDDNTTTYDISLKNDTANTYIIAHNSGTSPDFRIAKSLGHDSTTIVCVEKNGPLLTYTSTAGTIFDLVSGGVQVGDEVRIGSNFNLSNQGKYKILSFTATSFTVENPSGVEENNIILGLEFASQLQIYSADGVQVGDKVRLSSGFSSVSFGTYEITDVSPQSIEIYSIRNLPEETNKQTQLEIYNNSKKFIYVESDKKVSMTIDGVSVGNIENLNAGTCLKNGFFIKTGESYSASITNLSNDTATIFYVFAE